MRLILRPRRVINKFLAPVSSVANGNLAADLAGSRNESPWLISGTRRRLQDPLRARYAMCLRIHFALAIIIL